MTLEDRVPGQGVGAGERVPDLIGEGEALCAPLLGCVGFAEEPQDDAQGDQADHRRILSVQADVGRRSRTVVVREGRLELGASRHGGTGEQERHPEDEVALDPEHGVVRLHREAHQVIAERVALLDP